MLKPFNNLDVGEKFLLERINSSEKQIGELFTGIASLVRQEARIRDKKDDLAKVIFNYSQYEPFHLSLAAGLGNFSKALTLMADAQNLQVRRVETKVLPDLAHYELICKRMRENMKDAIAVQERQAALKGAKNRKGATMESGIHKANQDQFHRMQKEFEEFEKKKLFEIKSAFRDFILIQLKYHASAVELLSAAYQDIVDVDEEKDVQQIKKQLLRDDEEKSSGSGRMNRMQRIRSQSMGALTNVFGPSKRLQSQSSTSLNSPPGPSSSPQKEQTHRLSTIESLDTEKTESSVTESSESDSNDEGMDTLAESNHPQPVEVLPAPTTTTEPNSRKSRRFSVNLPLKHNK